MGKGDGLTGKDWLDWRPASDGVARVEASAAYRESVVPYAKWHDAVNSDFILSELFVTNESDTVALCKLSDWAANIAFELDRLPSSVEDLSEHLQDALVGFCDDTINELCKDVERTVESFMDGMARGEHLY